jgi:phage head maturation protease/predicted transcriptional regulator
MDHKTFTSYLLKADSAQGIVESIVAVMGNVDEVDDVIHPGSFVKTISERISKTRVLDQHNTDSILRVLGRPLAMREMPRAELPPDLLAKYPEATGGLYTKTQYNLQTDNGRNAFNLIAAGDVNEYSIGYDPLDFDFSKMQLNGKERTVRNLRTIKLYEYSPVIWGANSATGTISAKGATGASDLPLAGRDAAWDAAAAEGRVRTWAGATDAPNAKYRSAFFWYDSEAADNFTSYKLQFADVVSDKLTAMPRGIFAVAGVLQGARGGASIPAADQDAIKGKVEAYYAKMRKEFDDDTLVAPWAKGKSRKAGAQSFSEALIEEVNENDLRSTRWNLESALSDSLDSIAKDSALLPPAKADVMRQSLTQYADALINWYARAIDAGLYDQETGKSLLARIAADRKSLKMGMGYDDWGPPSALQECIWACNCMISICLDCCRQCEACPDAATPEHQAVIAACQACISMCLMCIQDCSGLASSAECVKRCIACAAMCVLCQAACEQCALACPNCAEVCTNCAEACEGCADACNANAGVVESDAADANMAMKRLHAKHADTTFNFTADARAFVSSGLAEVETLTAKAGRVQAARNVERLKRIMSELQAILKDAGLEDDLAADDKPKDEKPKDDEPKDKKPKADLSVDKPRQAGPSDVTPTDNAVRQSIEIEQELLSLSLGA